MHPFFCARNKNCLRVGGERRKPEEVVMTRALDTWMLYGREGFLLKSGSYEVYWNLTWCSPCLLHLSLVSVIQEVKMPVTIMPSPLPQRKLLGTNLLISCLLYLPPIFIPQPSHTGTRGKLGKIFYHFRFSLYKLWKDQLNNKWKTTLWDTKEKCCIYRKYHVMFFFFLQNTPCRHKTPQDFSKCVYYFCTLP